jgi:hypothetical protein
MDLHNHSTYIFLAVGRQAEGSGVRSPSPTVYVTFSLSLIVIIISLSSVDAFLFFTTLSKNLMNTYGDDHVLCCVSFRMYRLQ